jgi:hypothetical protein
MTYIDVARERLAREMPGLDSQLLDLYTLLVLVKGPEVTNEDVHDAWSVWRSRTNPDHHSLIPFDELERAIQNLDTPYAEAIAKVAASLRI